MPHSSLFPAICLLLAPALATGAPDGPSAATVYAARISDQPGWEDIITAPSVTD
jgi:hypothetical protein